jgi:H+/Cl- antiporter ClcA
VLQPINIRAEVWPERLNSLVFGVFAVVAVAIAVVGVAGVLAFSVSGRTRVRCAHGDRLNAVGHSCRRRPQRRAVAVIGIVAGLIGVYVMTVAASYRGEVQMPGATPIVAAAGLLIVAAVVASIVPIRASRIDVMQALRSE